MSWRQLFHPNLIVKGTVLTLTHEQLVPYCLQGLILDVDETLLPSSAEQVSPELKQWVDQIRPHYKLWLVTNNLNLPRMRRISQELDLPFYLGAGKPSRRKLRRAMEEMNVPPGQLGIIGDRLFTDVLAGNRLGGFTILVDPFLPATWTDLNPIKHPKLFLVRWTESILSWLLGIKLKT